MKMKTVTGIFLTILLVGVLIFTFTTQPVSAVDWWSIFHHDPSHTGYSTSTAPKTNNTLWKYKTEAQVWSSPSVVDGRVFVASLDA